MKTFPDLAVALLLAITPPAFASEPDVMTKLFDAQLALAKRGDVNAYYHIGEMYEQGLGTAQNLDEARSWYAKAADKGLTKARDKLAKWSKIEDERARASERAAARARQAEEARLANEARERAAREAADERARMEAQAKARAQEAARLQALQQAKTAAEARARVEQETRRQAEAAALARAEAAKKAANESRPADPSKTMATSDGGANGEPGGHAEPKASASTDAKRAAPAGATGTPVQALISRQTETGAKADATSPRTDGGPESQPSEGKQFSANPCSSLTAKFLSTCR